MLKYLLFGLLLLNGQQSIGQALYFPPATFEDWAENEMDCADEQLLELEAWLAQKNTKSFMILKDGKILSEMYFDGFTRDSIWYWASAGKSLMGVLIGKAQQEGLLNIEDSTADYLGTGWTTCTAEQESEILIRHQITMTTGLDEGSSFDCTDPECLTYLTVPEERWFYHNAPYTLTQEVLKSAAGLSASQYFKTRIGDKIGAAGLFVNLGDNKTFFSRTRDAARFGLLVLANGQWEDTAVYTADEYMQNMSQSSQLLNPAYGYLWWLNGKENYLLPGISLSFNGSIVPSAPNDMFAAMGKNDQRIYISPSENLVVVRLGNAADELATALSPFDEDLWQKINAIDCLVSNTETAIEENVMIFPNPTNGRLAITGSSIKEVLLFNSQGNHLAQFFDKTIDLQPFPPGIYFLKIIGRSGWEQWKRVVVAE